MTYCNITFYISCCNIYKKEYTVYTKNETDMTAKYYSQTSVDNITFADYYEGVSARYIKLTFIPRGTTLWLNEIEATLSESLP